jgi:hypothetical protein
LQSSGAAGCRDAARCFYPLTVDGILDGGGVLPGVTLAVRGIFPQEG